MSQSLTDYDAEVGAAATREMATIAMRAGVRHLQLHGVDPQSVTDQFLAALRDEVKGGFDKALSDCAATRTAIGDDWAVQSLTTDLAAFGVRAARSVIAEALS